MHTWFLIRAHSISNYRTPRACPVKLKKNWFLPKKIGEGGDDKQGIFLIWPKEVLAVLNLPELKIVKPSEN